MATLVGLAFIVLGALTFLFGAALAVDRVLQYRAKTTGPTSTATPRKDGHA